MNIVYTYCMAAYLYNTQQTVKSTQNKRNIKRQRFVRTSRVFKPEQISPYRVKQGVLHSSALHIYYIQHIAFKAGVPTWHDGNTLDRRSRFTTAVTVDRER